MLKNYFAEKDIDWAIDITYEHWFEQLKEDIIQTIKFLYFEKGFRNKTLLRRTALKLNRKKWDKKETKTSASSWKKILDILFAHANCIILEAYAKPETKLSSY